MPLGVRYYTDPACPASWAAEPALRRLMVEFGADLAITYVMGGLGRGDVMRHRRRLTLESRTLTTTLQSALTDLERSDATSTEHRLRLRREWCQRVRLLLQEVRGRSMQLDLLLRNRDPSGTHAPPPLGTGYLDDAEALLREMESSIS